MTLHLDNPWYGPMDAHVLYAMLRHSPPQRVLELGSGFSTLIIDRALRVNPGATTDSHDVIDPFPSPVLTGLRGRVRIREVSGAAVDPELFERLEAGDVLFVDTSHSVRPGGEAIRLVLDVLPTLNPGVLVHFHDNLCAVPLSADPLRPLQRPLARAVPATGVPRLQPELQDRALESRLMASSP